MAAKRAPRGEDAALIARVSELLPDFDSYFGAEEADPRSNFYRIPSFRTRTGSAHHERHSSLGLNLKLLTRKKNMMPVTAT